MVEKFRGCMVFLLFAGKLSRLYSNSKHLIIQKKKFAGKPSRLEVNPREPRKFSTTNDLHYTVFKSRDQHERNGNWILHTSKHAIKFILIEKSHLKPTSNNINDIALILTK